MKRSLLIICNSDLSREPRVIRQIMALKEDFKITTVGAQASNFKEITHIDINDVKETPKHWNYSFPVRKAYSASLKIYERFKGLYLSHYFENGYWTKSKKEILNSLASKKFDVIIAHHWDALPLASEIAVAGTTRLIFNAHDYYPRQFEKNENWAKNQKKLVEHVMNKYVPKFNLIYAAWTKINDDFQEFYGVPSIIINNATEYNDLHPQLINEGSDKIRIIHHGIANSNRKIELMIEMMGYLDDRFTLDLMVIPSPHEMEYYKMLQQEAAKNKNITFIDPVPTREIAKRINSYDIGLFLLPPNGFNPTFTLPNKLFEFVQGRLATLVTPNVEMKSLVDNYDLGWVSDDFEPESAANKIKHISVDEINLKKLNAHKHAFDLAAEVNYKKIKESVFELLENKKNKATILST